MYDRAAKPRIIRGIERRIFSRLNKLKSIFDIRKNYDIIHPTYYDPYVLGRYKGKLILTVHDMIHERYADTYFKHDLYTVQHKKKMIQAADRIIAISESTKRDLLEFFPELDPSKISIIYHGASMKADDIHAGEFSRMDGRNYILFVGARWIYKNFKRFVKAVIPVLETHKDLHVFCSGGGAFKADELDMFGEYSSRFHQGGLNDDELAAAYKNALCFVFPSEYEGFGIPLLEAFACNCPVVCSGTTSLPEVAGDAAEYFDPLNVDDISAKISKVIDDETLRTNMKSRGRERLKLFDWDKTARETLECYELALK